MRTSTVVIFNQLNIKNNKIDKDNFEKKYNKTNHEKNYSCNFQSTVFYKKKTTKLNFQPAQYEKNKFNKDNFGKKNR